MSLSSEPSESSESTSAPAAASRSSPRSSARRFWLYGGIGALALGAGAGGAWLQRRLKAVRDSEAGGPAGLWTARLERPDGTPLDISRWRGQPMLINFWATWCTPCVEEMPMLDAYFREHAAKGFQIIGLAIDLQSSVNKFLSRTPISYPIGIAPLEGTRLLRDLSNGVGDLPFSLFLDADGKVRGRKMGRLQISDLEGWRQSVTHG